MRAARPPPVQDSAKASRGPCAPACWSRHHSGGAICNGKAAVVPDSTQYSPGKISGSGPRSLNRLQGIGQAGKDARAQSRNPPQSPADRWVQDADFIQSAAFTNSPIHAGTSGQCGDEAYPDIHTGTSGPDRETLGIRQRGRTHGQKYLQGFRRGIRHNQPAHRISRKIISAGIAAAISSSIMPVPP